MRNSLILHVLSICFICLAKSACALNYNISLTSQVRSAYYGSTGMTISWNTFSKLANPTVHYGFSATSLDMSASSNISITYNTSLTYNNHVQLSGLLPNTRYYYLPSQLINAPRIPYTFVTARPLGDQTPYKMAVVVDMGAMGKEGLTTSAGKGIPVQDILLPGEQNTIQSLTSEGATFEFLLQPGDLAYADTWLTETNQGFLDGIATPAEAYKAYESILDGFYNDMVSITGTKAYMVGPGNHEANCIDAPSNLCMPGQSNFTGYQTHFRMPSDVATQSGDNNGSGNMWYSFDHGSTHFVVLNTETDFPGSPDDYFPTGPFGAPGAQVAWLTRDLAGVNRTITPWVVVSLHRPWYTSGGTCPTCQAAFEHILNQYNVDLVIAGHYHVYERNVPIHEGGQIDQAGLANPTSPWYIVNGIGGHYGGLNPWNRYSAYKQYGLSIDNATYGWSRLTFHNCTHLTHELVNSSSNVVLDTATLYKNRTCSLINNYQLANYGPPQSLPGAINAPSGYLAYTRTTDYWNPSKCALDCNRIRGCMFFTVYKEYHGSQDTGTTCAFYSQVWSLKYATNIGQWQGQVRVSVQNAYSYARS